MALSLSRLFAITVASVFLILAVAVSQASGARILAGGRHPEGASAAITESVPRVGAQVVRGSNVESSPSFLDCRGAPGNHYKSMNALLLGFLPKGTVVPPSAPSQRSNGLND